MTNTDLTIQEHARTHPLLDRLRGQAFIPGVHYASQADAWMREAADEIDRLHAELAIHDAHAERIQAAMLALRHELTEATAPSPSVCMKCNVPKGTPGPCSRIGIYTGDLHQWTSIASPQDVP